jgi:radical SAM superfamily enzyme YgiQ (UPF0313 family)
MAVLALLRPPVFFRLSSYSVPVTMPAALAYLAAGLLRHGHRVRLVDGLGADLDHVEPTGFPGIHRRGLSDRAILDRIGSRPDAIGISAMFTNEWPHVRRIAAMIRQHHPDIPILFGGEHAAAAADAVLRDIPQPAFVALGEGDIVITEFADFLDGRRPIEQVSGLALFRDGRVVRTSPAARAPIEALPRPAWEQVDMAPYFRNRDGYGVHRGRAMPIVASRGCNHRCRFCSSSRFWAFERQVRPPADVVDEIAADIARFGVEDIHFLDIDLVAHRRWMLAFCDEIARRGLRFTWQLPSGVRIEQLDRDVLVAMRRAGCRNVTVSPESGSERTLRAIRKNLAIGRFLGFVRDAKRAGLNVKCNLIIGFPDESWADVGRTFALLFRLVLRGADDAGVFVFAPYPGSELHDELVARGELAPDWGTGDTAAGYTDLGPAASACRRISPAGLAAARLLGMALFYGLGFLIRPWRLARLARNLAAHRSETVFEQRLAGTFERRRLVQDQRKPVVRTIAHGIAH